MNNTYIYPQNLKASANLWLWSLKDIGIIGVSLLLSVLALAQLHSPLLLGITAVFAFLTIRLDDQTVLGFIKNSVRFFILTGQVFIWKSHKGGQ